MMRCHADISVTFPGMRCKAVLYKQEQQTDDVIYDFHLAQLKIAVTQKLQELDAAGGSKVTAPVLWRYQSDSIVKLGLFRWKTSRRKTLFLMTTFQFSKPNLQNSLLYKSGQIS